VWEGVFNNFKEAGGDLDAFESDTWINKQKDKICHHLYQLENVALGVSKDYPLSIVVSMLLSQQDKVSIMDFGGGMGFQYLELLAKVPLAKEKVMYAIVDGKQTLDALPNQMRMYRNLHFSTTLEMFKNSFDIVHIGSTLQYIENWRELLHNLNHRYQPKYFVFSDLLAGDIPTFTSHQLFYGKKIPHLFLNWNEFANYMSSDLGFLVHFKSKFIHNILNQEDIFPNFGIPPTHQIDRGLNVIFCRQ